MFSENSFINLFLTVSIVSSICICSLQNLTSISFSLIMSISEGLNTFLNTGCDGSRLNNSNKSKSSSLPSDISFSPKKTYNFLISFLLM